MVSIVPVDGLTRPDARCYDIVTNEFANGIAVVWAHDNTVKFINMKSLYTLTRAYTLYVFHINKLNMSPRQVFIMTWI